MGDAPSGKSITDEFGMAAKWYWRMGSHCYNMDYDGRLNGESLPFNDIAIAIKLSVPSTISRKTHGVKIGMQTKIYTDEYGNKLDSELTNYKTSVDFKFKDEYSLQKYQDEFDRIFN